MRPSARTTSGSSPAAVAAAVAQRLGVYPGNAGDLDGILSELLPYALRAEIDRALAELAPVLKEHLGKGLSCL